jgi:Tol biopolymer transport system component
LPYDILRPVISPNGETIYFSVMVAGKCRIWQVPTNGGQPSQVVDGDVYRWALAPDGDHIAYSAFDDRIRAVRTHIYSLSQMNEEKIFEIAPETCMDWSNDGIYFDTVDDGSQNVWRQPLDGSPAKTVTSFDTQQVFRFAWEPNGKNLACIRHTTTFDAVELRFD